MCEYLFLFVLCQNVTYYCTAPSAEFDWICALQVFIIIIIIIIHVCITDTYTYTHTRARARVDVQARTQTHSVLLSSFPLLKPDVKPK